jgi:hypothetical protein
MTVRRDNTVRNGSGQQSAGFNFVRTLLPDSSKPLASQEPLVLLAMCIFGEARGECQEAQRGVAQIVLNRARNPHVVFGSQSNRSFEDNLRRVILRPGQFSCFHPADPNYQKLLRPSEAEDAAVWERCLSYAEEALAACNQPDTITLNSDHYFDDSIQAPSWADPAKRTVKLGRLNFYRLYLPAPATSGFADRGSGLGPQQSSPESSIASRNSRVANAQPADETAQRRFALQEPPEPEPTSAAPGSRPSLVTGLVRGSVVVAKLRASLRRLSRIGVLFHMSLPRQVPHSAWNSRPLKMQREPGVGRLSSLKTVTSDKRRGTFRWSALLLLLLLTGCSEFERTAYRTLAVTRAEYETVQSHMAEAAVHGLISEDQWNRFAVQGHRFIEAHNAAVDAFELWSRVKTPANEARVEALLEILPRLVGELNRLAESLEEK